MRIQWSNFRCPKWTFGWNEQGDQGGLAEVSGRHEGRQAWRGNENPAIARLVVCTGYLAITPIPQQFPKCYWELRASASPHNHGPINAIAQMLNKTNGGICLTSNDLQYDCRGKGRAKRGGGEGVHPILAPLRSKVRNWEHEQPMTQKVNFYTYDKCHQLFPSCTLWGKSATNMTFSIGFCFMRNETNEAYAMALNKLAGVWAPERTPQVVVTDREKALRNAIARSFVKDQAGNGTCSKSKWNEVQYAKDEATYDAAWARLCEISWRASAWFVLAQVSLEKPQGGHGGFVFEKIADAVTKQVTRNVVNLENQAVSSCPGIEPPFKHLHACVLIHALHLANAQHKIWKEKACAKAGGADDSECTGSYKASMGIPCWHMVEKPKAKCKDGTNTRAPATVLGKRKQAASLSPSGDKGDKGPPVASAGSEGDDSSLDSSEFSEDESDEEIATSEAYEDATREDGEGNCDMPPSGVDLVSALVSNTADPQGSIGPITTGPQKLNPSLREETPPSRRVESIL
ncbi:hypothetical protein PGT21_024361 [Puccinia graminis f. sp. tritici]|uniref:MULE transposase domain-containing protein n=1 Tax=Puccinia graminis f. sp. tritici TaxID=56615 RepID=A0A5B0M1Z2_PUCGR|nr:hypothetical protein PGT21_024361 [Puccinia graminis f. sp. tritici]